MSSSGSISPSIEFQLTQRRVTTRSPSPLTTDTTLPAASGGGGRKRSRESIISDLHMEVLQAEKEKIGLETTKLQLEIVKLKLETEKLKLELAKLQSESTSQTMTSYSLLDL